MHLYLLRCATKESQYRFCYSSNLNLIICSDLNFSRLSENELVFCPIETFIKMHSAAMERKNNEKVAKISNFLENEKSLNHFYILLANVENLTP